MIFAGALFRQSNFFQTKYLRSGEANFFKQGNFFRLCRFSQTAGECCDATFLEVFGVKEAACPSDRVGSCGGEPRTCGLSVTPFQLG